MAPRPVAARGSALLLFALAIAVGAGCGPPGPLTLGWRFVDGRACTDAGAASVQLTGPIACAPCLYRCTEGAAGATVTVIPSGGGTLTARALSDNASTLYQGTLDTTTTSPATVLLYVVE